jgi:glycosyltransferase involved in cell wall biosynthesis
MVREDGEFCGQQKIDPHACTSCMPLAHYLDARRASLDHARDLAACLIVPSQSIGDLYRANGAAAPRLHLVSADTPSIDTGLAASARTKLCMGFAAPFLRETGAELLANALRLLAADEVEIVTGGCDEAGNPVPPQASPYRLTGARAARHGFSTDAPEAFLREIDVFLHLSQGMRGTNPAVMAALADGVFVIAIECGAASDAIADGVTGRVVPAGIEASALAAILRQTIEGGQEILANRPHRRAQALSQSQKSSSEVAMLRQIFANIIAQSRGDAA